MKVIKPSVEIMDEIPDGYNRISLTLCVGHMNHSFL